jgi:uncharacterized membrane protein
MAAVAARAVARRDGFPSGAPVLLAGLTAAAAAVAGHRLRAVAARRAGSDLPGAFTEDAVAVALGRLGTSR